MLLIYSIFENRTQNIHTPFDRFFGVGISAGTYFDMFEKYLVSSTQKFDFEEQIVGGDQS